MVVFNDKLSKHDCPLAVIKCVDFRFRKSDQEFVETGLGYEDFDLYSWPGSAKEVLKDNGFKKSFIDKIISVSKNLHSIQKLLLLWHWDCGGYGGSKAFNSAEEEEQVYINDMRNVKNMLEKDLPEDIEIIMAYSKPAQEGLEYTVVE